MTSKHTLTVYSVDNKFTNSKTANWTTSKPDLMFLRKMAVQASRNIYRNRHEDWSSLLESRTVERTSTSTPRTSANVLVLDKHRHIWCMQ